MACRILVFQPRIQPASPPVKEWSLNHWTFRIVPDFIFKSRDKMAITIGGPNYRLRGESVAVLVESFLAMDICVSI